MVASVRSFRGVEKPAEPRQPATPLPDNDRDAATRTSTPDETAISTVADANELLPPITVAPSEWPQPPAVKGWVALGKELYDRFNHDEGFMRASALAFIGVLSFVPILLLGLAILGFVIHDPHQASDYIRQIMGEMLPGERASRVAAMIINQTNIIPAATGLMKGKMLSVIVGVLSLLWTAILLFVNASAPMNAAWDVQETRGFIKLRVVCLGVFMGAGALFVMSLLPSSALTLLKHVHNSWLVLPVKTPFWLNAFLLIAAWTTDVSMFVLIYRFLPNAQVRWKSAIFGGTVTGILWELFKLAFEAYLDHFANFNKLYGTLGGMVLLVTWVYYSCVLLLIGATLCKMYQEHAHEGGVARKAPHHRWLQKQKSARRTP